MKKIVYSEKQEIPCIICGNNSDVMIMKNMKHTDKYVFHVCHNCFDSFARDFKQDNIKTFTQDEVLKIRNEQLEYQEEIKMSAK